MENFDDLFRYNYRPLCLYALHYLQDADQAEDVVQESYAALWEKLQEAHGDSLCTVHTP